MVSFDFFIMAIVVQGLNRNIVSVVDEVGTVSDSVQESHILSAREGSRE